MKTSNLTKKEETIQRAKDEHILEFLFTSGELIDAHHLAAFQDMEHKLQNGQPVLTGPQRRYCFAICRELAPDGEGWDDDGLTPAERNKNVPRGNEVPTPPVLQNLPKKPPMRRT